MRNLLLLASMLSLISAAASSSAMAQSGRNDNPNMRNFYMARQQVQITDDAPAVNDLRTNPAAAQQGGGAPTRPQALPRAGFSTYMSGYTGGGGKSALPTVNNGVPPKLPSAGPDLTGKKASAGKLTPKAPAAPKGPAVAKSYKPYATTPSVAASGGSAGSSMNTSTNVQGSVLHWNKRRSGY